VGVPAFNVLSLCSGVGGLELGLKLAVPSARTVCYVEREGYCCEILAERMEDGCLDDAPVWSDLRTFDGGPWRGVVDCVTGGYPCQPFSKGGFRHADADRRHLWPHVARTVRRCEPPFCLFENVPNHLHLGFAQVHDELEEMGFRVAAGLFRTSELGGPTESERFFVLAAKAHVPGVQGLLTGAPAGVTGPWGWRGQEDLQTIAAAPFQPNGRFPAPLLRRVPDGPADVVDRLRAAGNAVVPALAARAWRTLGAALNDTTGRPTDFKGQRP
jgi:site-specific DNA-cytosine methylase